MNKNDMLPPEYTYDETLDLGEWDGKCPHCEGVMRRATHMRIKLDDRSVQSFVYIACDNCQYIPPKEEKIQSGIVMVDERSLIHQ